MHHCSPIQKHRQSAKRARLGDTVEVEKMSRIDLLETYWETTELEDEEAAVMIELAKEVFADLEVGDEG